ncbi:MAG: RluA family pseudouridine synthase [Candidatus Omnitrophota bacterium]|jgi:23S rRNA pseudouridine1911/1915/1917 synthase
MKEYTLTVLPENAGKRLDMCLMDFFAKEKLGFSRMFIQKLIAQGNVSLAQETALKAHGKVKAADVITVCVQDKEESLLQPEDIPIDIIYEDKDVGVIYKPTGLVVHPAPGNLEHTLVNALLHHFKQLSDINPQRPGIVHRLDKDTSGILVVAKNNLAHLALSKQFAQHTIKRHYAALVKGRMEFNESIIELPIGRHPDKRQNMSVNFGENTRFAKTYYRSLKRSKTFSYLELEPFTGRTHQLRVHLAYMGHPILGDKKYGQNNQFSRLALHARSLGFTHPVTGKFIEFSCDIPQEFKDFIKLEFDKG